ncbi:DUF2207 domain-containing protein [Candidatus Saccharibacteria bacterium]|nr:DUF2207 domain-containing protein [Candidatus Saccharibacteria bacterium]
MELVLLLIVLGAVLFGSILGVIVRKYKIRNIRKKTLQKPQYSIEDDLSPAEFGFIIDGKIGHKELVAEVIQLSLDGHIKLEKDNSGKLTITRIYGSKDRLQPLQAAILKEIGSSGRVPYTLSDVIEYETTKSLNKKGWIVTPKTSPRYMSEISLVSIVKAIAVALVGLLIIFVVSVLIGLSGGDLYMAVALSLLFEIFIAFIVGLIAMVKGEMLHSIGPIRGATTKYKQNWQNVKGVYDYIKISGMDIFTPDYEALDFDKLDELYPYAVAAGFDKHILRLFS